MGFGRPVRRPLGFFGGSTTRRLATIVLVVIGIVMVIVFINEGSPPASPQPHIMARSEQTLAANFVICGEGPRIDCVVDGDTFWYRGDKIRIADIDAPELSPPRCQREAELGEAAKRRLRVLLNAGPFTLAAVERDQDRYGRKLRTVSRGGRSLGDMLIAEGLARRWGGPRQSWCGG
ncbi:putative nuclease (plasmid) [Afipia carboxidovorans OM5]|uniref:Putative nuclease n=1 Tax=Afipia carboxidovorans (strain ATCC 49405 / DSM 1227 / KCTC 32145 / OM5) TaxID=504832 RepID=F8C166_AFIC5|nr:thermonuclease family protein [Afipia carboxidovorans]AEI04547.1 putative nuclease [Afipia carboxidovorans OM4]AEI08176.1 putative nuclease [Afipia carboxidovorans OM5]